MANGFAFSPVTPLYTPMSFCTSSELSGTWCGALACVGSITKPAGARRFCTVALIVRSSKNTG